MPIGGRITDWGTPVMMSLTHKGARALDNTDVDIGIPKSSIYSIANQLRYGIVVLIVLSLVPTAGILIYISFHTQREQSFDVVQGRSRIVANEINAYVEDLQSKLSYLARVQGLTQLPPETLLSLLGAVIRNNSAYEIVAVIDSTGRIIAEVSPYGQLEADNLADSPPFIYALSREEYFVGSVELDSATQLPMTIFSVPVRNQQDQVDGVLLARVNLRFLWFVVSQVDVGQTGYAYVLDNRNVLIAENERTAANYRPQDISQRSFIQKLTSGAPKPTTYQGLRGTQVIAAISPIRSVHWNTVVELPTAEAYSRIRHMIFIMGGAVAVAVAFAVPISIFFSRRVSSPLQRLTEASIQIGAGNMGARVNVGSRDEMGVLAETFNQMAGNLQTANVSLENRTDALERSNQELQEFVYAAAHDLQEPLRKVQAFGDRLMGRYSDALDERGIDYLSRMRDASGRMQTLINDLLTYSRVTTKAKPFMEVDLNEVAQEVVSDLEIRLEETNGRVEIGQLPTIEADRTQIRQLLQNLMGNALKFGRLEEPPVVTISGRIVHAAASSDDPQPRELCEIVVEDNGIGFEDAYKEQIFAIFNRLHGRTEYEGTGLGLAVCRKIVQRHGGGDLGREHARPRLDFLGHAARRPSSRERGLSDEATTIDNHLDGRRRPR